MIIRIKKLSNKLLTLSRTNRNSFWLVALSLAIALCQFTVYALIDRILGKDFLGVWSLVVAATSIGQISSFGFSNSIVRYLPEMLTKKETANVGKMLGTVNFSNFFLTLPILLLLYFPAVEYASHLLNARQLEIFKSVIPLSMGALFINNLFLVYSYFLDAMQKYYLRSAIQIGGWLVFVTLSAVLIRQYGLQGVAIAFFIQNLLQFLIILVLISKRRILNKIYPIGFDKESFQKVSSFGLKSQSISILVIFFDPLVKFFITKNIGLAATGNYEISNKIVLQARNLLVSTNQVIIPKIVLHRNTGTENAYFDEISKRNIVFAIGAGLLIMLVAPLPVYFFSGNHDNTLMNCIIVINLGWVCNMVTSVHYYCCIGLDKIGKLVFYHLILSVTITLLYLLLNRFVHVTFLYFAVPAVGLFVGSIYNSYLLSKNIARTYSWLTSGLFLYFLFVSFVLLFIYQTSSNTIAYVAMPVLFLLYICWILKKYRVGKLLNFNSIGE